MRRPSVEDLPPRARDIARDVARRIAAAGARAWLVGGTVRDLALGEAPVDLDLASALSPERIEPLFARTVPVGRAFGSVVLPMGATKVQLTTFRAERGYSDGRRPDEIRYGASLEEDARRRDFTCNALYLDPLDDELADPERGAADIERRTLRAIGDPAERFREDGLRLVRLARFHARLDFEVETATLAAARACAQGMRGVSGERLRGELERILAGPRAHRALALLAETGVLEVALPELLDLRPAGEDARAVLRLREAALEHLAARGGLAAGLALLLDPDPRGEGGPGGGGPAWAGARRTLDALKPSREERQAVEGLWSARREILACAPSASGARPPARAVRLLREGSFETAACLEEAWSAALGRSAAGVDSLRRLRASLEPDQLRPAPLIRADDLAAAGVPRGPLWKSLLAEAEDAQLERRFSSREQALLWLAERARQVGGNERRSASESG